MQHIFNIVVGRKNIHVHMFENHAHLFFFFFPSSVSADVVPMERAGQLFKI